METRSATTTSVKEMSGNSSAEIATTRDFKPSADEFGRLLTSLNISPKFFKQLPEAAADVPVSHETALTEVEDTEEYEARRGDIVRQMGRKAIEKTVRLDKRIIQSVRNMTWKALSKLPSNMSVEERNERHRAKLEKVQPMEGDSRFVSMCKTLRRNQLRIGLYGAPAAIIGYLAVGRYGGDVVNFGANSFNSLSDKTTNFIDDLSGPRQVTMGDGEGYDMAANAIDYAPVERNMAEIYDSKAIIMGGHTDTTSVMYYNQLTAQGIATGEANLVESPASIAPVGPVSMEVTSDIASMNGAEFYNPNDPYQQTIYGYSEGSAGAIKLYNDIVAANGGVKPDNLNLVLVGSPYAEGGFFKSDYVGAAGPVLDAFGIPTDLEVPAGATVIYSPNDLWANGDNQSFLGMMSQLLDTAAGPGHAPDMTGDFYMKIDENGVRHLIEKGTEHPLVELAEAHGMPLPPRASEFLQQIAPINNGMSDQVPQANAYAAYDIGGQIINEQTGTQYGTVLMEAVPDSVKNLSQSGLTAINNIPNTAAGIANGTISPQEGIPVIVDQLQDVARDVQPILQNPLGTAEEFMQNAIPPEARPFVQPMVTQGFDFVENALQDLSQGAHSPAPADLPLYSGAPAPVPALAPAMPMPVYEAAPAPVAAPAPSGGYAPVGPLFGSTPAQPTYAPVGNLFS